VSRVRSRCLWRGRVPSPEEGAYPRDVSYRRSLIYALRAYLLREEFQFFWATSRPSEPAS